MLGTDLSFPLRVQSAEVLAEIPFRLDDCNGHHLLWRVVVDIMDEEISVSSHIVGIVNAVLRESLGGDGVIHQLLHLGVSIPFPIRLPVVPNFNFDWHTAYRWEYGKQRLAKGTRLECVAHYDNSAFNPFNPDPKATIRDGPQASSEMMNAFFYYVRDGENLGLTVDGGTGRLKNK